MGGHRITFDPDVMGGQACIRGMRIPASLLANLLANGMSEAEILQEYPDLESEDIRQAARFASVPADLASASRTPRRTDPHPSPADWRDQIVYFLLPDRFSDDKEAGRQLFDRNNPRACAAPNLDGWREAGGKFQGGTIKGIERKLNYLQDLGVTALWLGPVWRQRAECDTYHGYAIQNFLDVDPRFGTVQDLCDLVAAAHGHKMYVLLDTIYNHTGNNWFYDLDGKAAETTPYRYSPSYPFHGWRSHTGVSTPHIATWDDGVWPREFQNPDWYVRAGKIENFDPNPSDESEYRRGDFIDLKKLNLYRADVLEALLHVYQYWIALTDCDGFRIDTLAHIPWAISRTFCWRIREFAESVGKDNFLLLGEVAGGEQMARSYLKVYGNHLDAVLDILTPAWLLTNMVKGFAPPSRYFDLFVPSGSVLGNHRATGRFIVSLLDDHDMIGRPRRRFAAGNESAAHQVAHATGVQLTTPGIPCIYYGTEQAFDGGEEKESSPFGDRFVRESMFGGTFGAFHTAGCHFFDPNHPTYVRIQAIARLRDGENSVGLALRRGRLYHREVRYLGDVFHFPDCGEITAWSRCHNEQEVLVVLNCHGKEPRGAEVTVDARLHPSNLMQVLYRGDWDHTQPRDLELVPVTRRPDGRATIRIDLPPGGMAILAGKSD